jgi:hypothetical protein
MFYRLLVRGALFAALLASTQLQAQGLFRAYLASSGNDANPCSVAAPCRLLPRALTVVADGGEIWMLDSANYNTATVLVAKSVTILAVPGAVGSVVANGGDAILIDGAGAQVTLRNLVLRALAGGNSGVVLATGDRVTVDGCLISGLASGTGISVTNNARLRVIDSVVRDNAIGISIDGGATADVTGTKIAGNSGYGLYVNALGGTTQAMVSDSVLAQNLHGAYATSNGGNARLHLTRVTSSKNTANGVYSESLSGTTVVSVGGSKVTGNASGLVQSGAGAILRTLGDNHVADNSVDVAGTLTPLAPR